MQYFNQFEMAMDYHEFNRYAELLLLRLSNEESNPMRHNALVNLLALQQLNNKICLTENLIKIIQNIRPLILVIRTEGYCGDSAHTFPVFAKMQEMFPEKIEIKVILRDEHLDISDIEFGTRAIPVVIGFDKQTKYKLFVWGNRPAPAQKLMNQLKLINASQDAKGVALHKWYYNDQTLTLQNELAGLLKRHHE